MAECPIKATMGQLANSTHEAGLTMDSKFTWKMVQQNAFISIKWYIALFLDINSISLSFHGICYSDCIILVKCWSCQHVELFDFVDCCLIVWMLLVHPLFRQQLAVLFEALLLEQGRRAGINIGHSYNT
uniref:Uncharacterized protein n=1 Tax=Romanomermis culicivorax TaxID=13658 RepID=A0A915K7R7_ROMCU